MPRSIGLPEIVVILLVCDSGVADRDEDGLSGSSRVLALFPGLNLILAYFHAFDEWPVLREHNALGRQPRG